MICTAGIVQRQAIGRRTADEDLRGLREAGALHDQGLARQGRRTVGNWLAGTVQGHDADHAVAQFGAQRRLGAQADGEEQQARQFHCGLPGGVLVTV